MTATGRALILSMLVLAATRPAAAQTLYGAGPLPNNDPTLGEES